ncbi:diacylglycerol/lipid kinase family protein [Faecalibacterium wellingii]|uniref:Diacylglycerol kinase family protein n=1 Tax=Faecalibacterium wellingii TaxID=2929491 RepID=A0ABU3TYE4_9FIRM|nr:MULTISPECIES: diacylglycerol kinase family protein [Faecalibacterium]MDU8688308.1 diacylglycerol kinase family protein [Faecalibacterium prausnitzii]UQK55370.1 protein BmrU [Faecalibacterium sp. HTF-F]
MRTLFLLNPTAGKADCTRALPRQIDAAAARAGLAMGEYTIRITAHAGHARELANVAARQARQAGEQLRIYTAGGDGTFNEALTGVYGFENAAVGCLPYGSGNDFLRTFGTKAEFLDLDAQLAGGPVAIDLMQTSLGLSATICAAGLDAQVAYGIPKFRRIPLCGGEAAYALSIVEQLCGHIGRRVEYTIDGETLTVDCLMCAVCNGRTYGGGFRAAPEAQPDDGWLDVYIIRKVSRLTIAKLLGMYKNGGHFRNGQLVRAAEPYFIYRRAKQVSLRAVDGRGPIVATADGECVPKEQITVQVQPLAGRILLPKPAFERFAAQRSEQSAT